MRSLVTGGQGFIGSNLARALLERGDEVVVMDLPGATGGGLEAQGIAGEARLIEGDVAEPADCEAAFEAGPFDSVFHLAAQTLVGPAAEDPVGTYRANVTGTWTLLEACRGSGVEAVVVASSDKAYGPSESLPYREGDELRPAAPYEGSKAAADVIARSYWRSWDLPVGVTRLANVYGGGDMNGSRLVPEVVVACLEGRAPVIRSDGSPERDFLYVDDAVAAYLAIEGAVRGGGPAAGQALNAGVGRPYPVREVIELIRAAAGPDAPPPRFLGDGSPEGEIDRQFVDPARLAELTGWRAEVELEQGIERTVAWYRSRHAAL